MTGTLWTPKQAWDYLANSVLKASDILPHFTFAAGCSDVDDFMYLGRTDFEIAFEVPSKDTARIAMTTSLTLSRVLAGKLMRGHSAGTSHSLYHSLRAMTTLGGS
jgi:hypothetical protein